MKRETGMGMVLLLIGVLFVAWRAGTSPRGVGTVYIVAMPPAAAPPTQDGTPPAPPPTVRYQPSARDADGAMLSIERTIGVWVAAILTLGVLSYLYRDNPLYKLVESVVVGVSAGYSFVVGFWDALVAKLLLKLMPAAAHAWAIPLSANEKPVDADLSYTVPLLLGILLFFRFIPHLQWLASWPLAFVVGMTAGLKLIVFLEADFVGQVFNTMMPLVVFTVDQQTQARVFNLSESIKNTLLVIGVVSSLTYFYFSVEHRGVVRQVARLGVWVLMITFGSSFAFTVMGRITLLTVRLEFLLGRWLGLIDVSG